MLKRRRLGLAYERCPAERVGEWLRRNMLVLIASFVGMGLWWVAVILIVSFLNWLATGGDPGEIPPYDPDDPNFIAVRIVGGLVVFVLIAKSRAK